MGCRINSELGFNKSFVDNIIEFNGTEQEQKKTFL